MPDKLKPEEAKRLIEELERIMQVGYGELHIKVQNARVISWKSEAQWELRKEV
jgi:hypothetical protein